MRNIFCWPTKPVTTKQSLCFLVTRQTRTQRKRQKVRESSSQWNASLCGLDDTLPQGRLHHRSLPHQQSDMSPLSSITVGVSAVWIRKQAAVSSEQSLGGHKHSVTFHIYSRSKVFTHVLVKGEKYTVYLGCWILFLVTTAQLVTFVDMRSPTSAAKQTVCFHNSGADISLHLRLAQELKLRMRFRIRPPMRFPIHAQTSENDPSVHV